MLTDEEREGERLRIEDIARHLRAVIAPAFASGDPAVSVEALAQFRAVLAEFESTGARQEGDS